MKTQIKTLRSGIKNQILNKEVDYSQLPQSTSHNGHAGANYETYAPIWEDVKKENKDFMRFIFLGKEYTAQANWSLSGKSVIYTVGLDNKDFSDLTGYKVARGKQATLSIQGSTTVILQNGGKYHCQVCPSFITIL